MPLMVPVPMFTTLYLLCIYAELARYFKYSIQGHFLSGAQVVVKVWKSYYSFVLIKLGYKFPLGQLISGTRDI